jgi:rhamnogalacturonyl hydrolase YesR
MIFTVYRFKMELTIMKSLRTFVLNCNHQAMCITAYFLFFACALASLCAQGYRPGIEAVTDTSDALKGGIFKFGFPKRLAAGQPKQTPEQLAGIARDAALHIGSAPDDAGSIATDLPYSTTPDAVAKALRKVADWQIEESRRYFGQIWTWCPLYSGFLAVSESLHDPKYRNVVEAVGNKFGWQLQSHLAGANGQCLGQPYLEMYLLTRDPAMMQPTQSSLDAWMATSQAAPTFGEQLGKKPAGEDIPWWWCDALYMAPATFARMYAATGDRKYIAYLDKEWARTSDLLYDPKEYFYSRDASYLTRTEANGKKMFWSRGTGWVMGGLVRTLKYLPKDDPARAMYIDQLQKMASRLAEIQGPDGLWRAGLLDPDAYDLPEISGSAFITYAMAAGVNQGFLDAKVYRPVIKRAWVGMLHHVYARGRLGCIQQTGADPEPFKPTASYTYGVGAFLLAGSEIRQMKRMN